MSRTAAIAVLALAVLPAAAVAKGPHASLSSPGEPPQPGEAWLAKLELFEFAGGEPPAPVVVARRRDERVAFGVQELSRYVPSHPDVMTEARYRLRGVFPSAGKWVVTVTAADPSSEPFRFELQVGGAGATPVRNLLAVPGRPGVRGTPLPPEVVEPPAAGARSDERPVRAWIPAACAALAAAGAAAVLRRRRPGPT